MLLAQLEPAGLGDKKPEIPRSKTAGKGALLKAAVR